ncbi:helix-turn-helix domain-containing protein [Saccharibacillus alkalitolerans]|uniref:Helix-turn-helix domain-containing protein n=1 Tax=Saccharibacillus alkalitolerans TaxID=2705290 RepID=A0ABX0F9K1_9BACL|nr:helix-turn-helix domain-containing protein [Saccharibacillus alkalitolerans]NGZ76699.1 helix-turn-helix domain-containing protein [Saccharibacillus alkalitolerans]
MASIRGWAKKLPGGRSRERRGRFYRYSLILALCMASIPTAVIALSSYALGTAHIEREVMNSHRTLVERSAARLDDLFTQLELSISQWSLDPRLGADLKRANLTLEYNRTNELYSFLGLMKATYPRLEDARLLLNRSEPLLVSESGGVRKIPFGEDSKRFQGLIEDKRDVYWVEGFHWNASDAGSLVLVRKLPGYGPPYGALLLSLNRTKLEEFVREASFEEKGASYLYAENGQSMIRVSEGMPENQLFEQTLRQQLADRIDEKAGESDSYLFKWQGKTYAASYSTLERAGTVWTYATVSPLEALTRPVVLLSRSLLGVSLFGMALALILAWFTSRRLHRPIRQLAEALGRGSDFRQSRRDGSGRTDEEEPGSGPGWIGPADESAYDELRYIESSWKGLADAKREAERRLEQTYPELRTGFLLQLMQGHYRSLGESELLSRLERFGWRIEQGERLAIGLLRVGVLSPPESQFREEDELLMTFAAANVAREFIDERSKRAEIVNFHDGSIAVLVPIGNQASIKETAVKMAETVRTVLRLRTIMCTGETDSILNVSELLQSLRSALRGVPAAESCRVLHVDELLPGSGRGTTYPFDLEKELLQEVRLGRIGEAGRLIDEFVIRLAERASSESELHEGSLQLLGSLLHVMLENGARPEGAGLYGRLLELRRPEAVGEFLRSRVLEPYGRELEERQGVETHRLAERVREELERDYNADFSLERCAERFGVSPYALSRSFKQAYGQTFVDYVMNLRLERARELLRTTDLKVNEIAEAVGYQPSYFIRLFRKQEGMTPGQYRAEKSG